MNNLSVCALSGDAVNRIEHGPLARSEIQEATRTFARGNSTKPSGNRRLQLPARSSKSPCFVRPCRVLFCRGSIYKANRAGIPEKLRHSICLVQILFLSTISPPTYEKNSSRLFRHSFRSLELRLFKRARPALNTARDDSSSLTRLSRSCLGRMR